MLFCGCCSRSFCFLAKDHAAHGPDGHSCALQTIPLLAQQAEQIEITNTAAIAPVQSPGAEAPNLKTQEHHEAEEEEQEEDEEPYHDFAW